MTGSAEVGEKAGGAQVGTEIKLTLLLGPKEGDFKLGAESS